MTEEQDDLDWEKAEGRKLYDKEYYQRNREKILKRHRERTEENRLSAKKWNLKLKGEVLSHYSKDDTPKCVWCGESRLICLSIDHINNDGAAHRKSFGYSSGTLLYRWLRRNNYPNGFQTLCMNCQFVKRRDIYG